MRTKSQVVLFFVICGFASYGFAEIISALLNSVFKRSLFSFGALFSVFFFFCLWVYEYVKKQFKIWNDERNAIEKHRRKKQSIILRNHPLLESSDDPSPIDSMDKLGYFFERHEDDVAGMDYDSTGHWIFQDHKYYK